ncbi:hypothetical protein ACFL4D_02525, partial [Candidatus Margulisiibacteriota bacterium]
LQKELKSITKKKSPLSAIKELAKRELSRKQNKYLFMINNFEKKYNMTFKQFEKHYKNNATKYEIEKDYFDWDMAITALEDLEEEFKSIQ